MDEKKIMKISQISIPVGFVNSVPRKDKIDKCRQFYKTHGYLDRDICVDGMGKLTDGYIGLLVLQEHGIEETQVVLSLPQTYVYGRHGTNPKEYVWKVTSKTKGLPVVGHKMLIRNGNKYTSVTITRIEILHKPPIPYYIKKIIKFF